MQSHDKKLNGSKFFVPMNPKTQKLYGQPKIHKVGTPIVQSEQMDEWYSEKRNKNLSME